MVARIRELEVKEICLSTLRLPNTRSDTKWQKNMMNRWLSSTLIAGKSYHYSSSSSIPFRDLHRTLLHQIRMELERILPTQNQ